MRNSCMLLISLVACILIASNNLITIITEHQNLMYAYIFVVPFYILSLTIYIMNKYYNTLKTRAVIFAMLGLLVTILGGQGNATGIIFLCFSAHIWNSEKTLIVLTSASILIIVIKTILLDATIPQSVNLILIYVYIPIIYYSLIYPKRDKNETKLDDVTFEILNLLALGFTTKETSEKLKYKMSESAIRKRINRACKNYDCANVLQLVVILSNLGYFKNI